MAKKERNASAAVLCMQACGHGVLNLPVNGGHSSFSTRVCQSWRSMKAVLFDRTLRRLNELNLRLIGNLLKNVPACQHVHGFNII